MASLLNGQSATHVSGMKCDHCLGKATDALPTSSWDSRTAQRVSTAALPGASDPATNWTVKKVAELLNGMGVAGVIEDYALFGAAAQMRYTEAIATLAADVLVALATPGRLDLLEAIYA